MASLREGHRDGGNPRMVILMTFVRAQSHHSL